MSDDEQVNQGEIAAINDMLATQNRQTSSLLGYSIADGLREHEERLAAEADNDEENGS